MKDASRRGHGWQADSRYLVPVVVDIGDQRASRLSEFKRPGGAGRVDCGGSGQVGGIGQSDSVEQAQYLLPGHCAAVGPSGHTTGGRIGAFAYPPVELDEEGPKHRRNIQIVDRVRRGQVRLEIGRPEVVGPVQEVGPGAGVFREVLAGVGILVEEAPISAPVLPRAVRGEKLWHTADRALEGQQAGVVVGRAVGGRQRMGEGRLAEAEVELAPPGAGDVGEHAVEHLPSLLVDVQTFEEELAEEPSRLRDPEREHPVVGVLQPRREIPDSEEPGADHRRERGAVDQLIPMKRLEPAVQHHPGIIDESPFPPRYRPLLAERAGPHRELGVYVLGVGGRIVAELEER